MEDILLVGIGGSIGAVLRYMVSGIAPKKEPIASGTLLVNIMGSLLLSILTFSTPQSSIMYAVNIGMLGAFTTFSTFAFETFKLLEEGQKSYCTLNILLNTSLCIAAVWIGYLMVNLI